MHIREPISRHAHTCIWKGTFMPSIYTWGAIPHHISILVPFWHGYIFWKTPYATYPQIYIFWKAFLRYLSYTCRFFKMHYLLLHYHSTFLDAWFVWFYFVLCLEFLGISIVTSFVCVYYLFIEKEHSNFDASLCDYRRYVDD